MTKPTTYSVHKAVGDDRVLICLDGYGPSDAAEGFADVGTFELAPDQLRTSSGDHAFVVEAKKLISGHEDPAFSRLNVDSLTYLDRASNAPVHMIQPDLADSTDDLPSSVDRNDPEFSAQAGGEGNTGLLPEQLEPNGVTPVESVDDAVEDGQIKSQDQDQDQDQDELPTAEQLVKDHTKDELLEMAKDIEGVTSDNNKAEIAEKIVAAR